MNPNVARLYILWAGEIILFYMFLDLFQAYRMESVCAWAA